MGYLDVDFMASAHRGGAEHPDIVGLENTLLAFQHAWNLGYRYLETDVHLTADGHLVAFHDDVLDRTTDTVGAISELSLRDVKTARVGGREEVPTLAELFEELPGAYLNIDLKAPGTARELATFLQRTKVHDRVVIGSFSATEMAQFRALTGGTVPTSAPPAEVARWRLSPTARIARRRSSPALAALQIPHRHRGVRVCTPGLVRRAHDAGLKVHVWTIDETEEMNYLIDLGVDGLMTDRTDILKTVLTERGLWRGTGA